MSEPAGGLPLVSLVIPTYNGEEYIGEALASARAQTYTNIEILIGEDGSTDGTRAIVADAASADPRIRVIQHEQNVGPVENQIELHRSARGAFIKPLLQDDRLAPDCVERLLPPLLADETVVVSFGRRDLIDAHGAPLPDQFWNAALTEGDTVIDGWELGSTMLERMLNLVGELSCALYRKDAIPDIDTLWTVGGHEFGPIADIALWLKLLAAGRAFYSPTALSSFRQHDAQSTHRPDVMQRGAQEWLLLVLAARDLGHLSSPRRERNALGAVLANGVNWMRQSIEDPVWSPRIRDAIGLAIERLNHPELALDIGSYPVAVAAPAVQPDEIQAGVDRLRSLAQDAVVGRCVIAIPPAELDEAVPHVERALLRGPDFELELTPTDTPGTVVSGPWLAVVTGEAGWAAQATDRVHAVG